MSALLEKIIEEEQFPTQSKIATIIPIYKNGTHLNTNNYRPISILSPITKIIESLLLKQMEDYATRNNVISSSQYRGRSLRSTLGPLSQIRDKIIRLDQEKRRSACILVDFSKAFDTVNRSTLLLKLSRAGFRGKILSLLASYFKDHIQYTRIGNVRSSGVRTEKGLPQGSILSPFLFNLYSSDLGTHLQLAIR